MKKILIIMLILALMSTAVFANEKTNIINKKQIQLNQDYIYEHNKIFLKVDSIQELLGEEFDLIPALDIPRINLIRNTPIPFEDIEDVSQNETIEVIYSNQIKILISDDYLNADSFFIVNSEGKEITNITYKREPDGIVIDKTYNLNLGETYIIKGLTENKLFEQKFFIKEFLTKDSFKVPHKGNIYKSVMIPAQPDKGFYFPYRLMYSTIRITNSFGDYTEESFDSTKDILYLESTNHGIDYSFEEMIINSKNAYGASLSFDMMLQTKHNGFAMIGIFPRLRDEGGIYTHALDRQTMFGTKEWWDKIDRGNLYRIDKQFIAMQKDARMQLANMGRNVGQPILTGFSASSDFVSRINYLYPDLARAVIVNDPPTVPLEDYNGVELKYPLGIADLEELTGEPFNKEKFLDTPQFWTTGKYDDNDGTYFSDGWGNYHLNKEDSRTLNIDRNQEGIDYRKAFGDEITSRKENVRRILKEKGFTNIETHTYDVGHGLNDKTLRDIEIFLNNILK